MSKGKKNTAELEKLLGKYKKKVSDQQGEIRRMRLALNEYEKGLGEVNLACDAVLAATAIRYGEPVYDEDNGEFLGYRLRLNDEDLRAVGKYDVRPRSDEACQQVIVAVCPKELPPRDMDEKPEPEEPTDPDEYLKRELHVLPEEGGEEDAGETEDHVPNPVPEG